MDFSQQLSNHFVKYPCLFTENLVAYSDYRMFFENKYDCKFTVRLPNPLAPNQLVENFSDRIVQTYFEVVSSAQGSHVVPTTIYQFDPEAHLYTTYALDDKGDKMICFGALNLKRPSRYIELLNVISKFEVKEEKRAVGFGPVR